LTKNSHKILVVDDEPEFLELMRSIISEMNYEVVTAQDGIEGLEKLKNDGHISVIFSDQVMPNLMGTEFLAI